MSIVDLLDAAKKITGSDYKTAKALGVPTQLLSNWRHGHGGKNPQPEDFALVAAIAGLDAEEALIRAVLEKHKDKPKGERLMSALGNVLRRTGEAVTLGFFGSVVLGSIPEGAKAATTAVAKAVATMCRGSKRQAGLCPMLLT